MTKLKPLNTSWYYVPHKDYTFGQCNFVKSVWEYGIPLDQTGSLGSCPKIVWSLKPDFTLKI